jgi:predicted acyltransferase
VEAGSGVPAESPPEPRLVAVDALRGFDMLWIAGGDSVVYALRKASDSAPARLLARQLDHSDWAGLTFYDLIFPLFVFIVGVSIVLALPRARRQPWPAALRRILLRGLLMFVLGMAYSGGLREGWAHVRLLGVLQRIAICYVTTALLTRVLRTRALAGVAAGLLLGYWALMTFVPVRDISLERAHLAALEAATGKDAAALYDATTTTVTHAYDDGRNLANHLDFRLLPLRKYDGAYDPEGLLSTLPAIATCLLGALAGLLLACRARAPRTKVRWLLVGGAAALLLGCAWGLEFPIIKKIWTSSYVLCAAGMSALLLAAFYQVIEVWNLRRWAAPFVWIGMNPIAIYLADRFVDFGGLAERVVGGPVKGLFGAYGQLLVTLVALGMVVGLAWFLHRRRIFLRL